MQFKIPKYLERESTIAFGLTFKNLAILGGVGLLLFLLYYVIRNKVLFFLIAIVIAGVFFLFTFVKIRSQSVMEILSNSLSFFFSPRTYMWQKKVGFAPIKVLKTRKKEDIKTAPLIVAPKSRLGDLRNKIDLGPANYNGGEEEEKENNLDWKLLNESPHHNEL